MKTENLFTLKIHKLSQEQYDRELAAGRIDENALYLTPDEEVDLSTYATIDQLNQKADSSHTHNDKYYTEEEIDAKVDELNSSIEKITGGTTTVKSAEHALLSDSATTSLDANKLGGQAPSYYAKTSDIPTGNLAEKDVVSESELDSNLVEKINVAFGGNHNHSNKAVLDGITSTKVSAWDNAEVNANAHTDEIVSGKADKTHRHDDDYDAKGSANDSLTESKTYTDLKTNGMATTTVVDTKISTHDASTTAHNDIRTSISDLQEEMDSKLSDKSDVGHAHDDKYYTEAEIDGKFSGVNKSISDHTGSSAIHVTSDNKTQWNAAYSHSTSAHAPSNAEKNIIVGIQKNGTDLTVNSSTRKVNITVPTTAAEVGAATSDHNHDSKYDAKGAGSTAESNAKAYTDEKVANLASTTVVDNKISLHNTSDAAHSDIRGLISALSTKVNNFLDVDDTKTDQLSEVLELIENNKGTLESLTFGKVNVSDIVDNLTTSSATKVLSAKQGVALKGLIDSLQAVVEGKANSSALTSHTGNTSNPHDVTKAQVGLGNVENKSSSTIRGEITKSNVTTALGYTPYTPTEVDTLLENKANASHGTHVTFDSTNKPKMDGTSAFGTSSSVARADHVHPTDTTRASQADLDALENVVSGKSDNGHTHDGRYYTESEIDTKLSNKANTSHGNHVPTTQTANNAVFLRNDNTWATVTPANIGAAASSHGTHVSYSTTNPVMDGTASVGSASTVARSDHKHPTDTSRAAQTALDSHTGDTTKHITSTERTNWNAAKSHADSAHAPSNAQANQNAFSNVKVGSTTIAADTTTDTLELVGSNVTITPDATNDKVTIAVADGTTSAKGIVKLENSTSSTSTTTAATPSSVKSAYDLANTAKTNAATAQSKADSAYTLANSKVDSLSDLGITATATELNYVDGVTSGIQAQLDGKSAKSHTHDYLPLSGGTMTGSIIIPKNDNMGIIPNTNNYGQIGSSDKKFYRMYATNYYGNRAQLSEGIEVTNRYNLGAHYNYQNGCLIEIGTASNATMCMIHITGNSFSSNGKPIDSMYQFYDYDSTNGITNYVGRNLGYALGNMTVYRYDGKLYAYIKQVANYQTLSFELITNKTGLIPKVSNSAAHTSGYANLVTITPDNVAVEGHTHKYAGSSSVGGSATSAVKLDTSTAGSATQPVYFSGGKPIACTYTLGKSVPSNAVFTDTTYSTFVKSGSGAKAGLVPAPSTTAGTTKYLREDGTWATPPDTNTTYSKLSQFTNDSGYITSITKAMVTTALGYTPPTSDTNTHYTTRIYAGASGTAANAAATSPYIKITDDNTYRNQIRLVGGGSTTVTSDASGNITISSTDTNTTYSAATQSAQGLMSAADKKKLDGIATGANAYSLPTASSSTLGGVKTTSTVTSTSGLTACPIISGVPYYKDTNTTYSLSSFGITATAAELNYCDGVTSNIQTQLNGKAASSHTHSYLPLSGGTVTGATTFNSTVKIGNATMSYDSTNKRLVISVA